MVQDRMMLRLTYAEVLIVFRLGVFKAWPILAVGFIIGYGLGALASSWMGSPFPPLPFERLDFLAPIMLASWFGVAGFVIELLRFQGERRSDHPLLMSAHAPQLRATLFSVLCVAAVGIGVFVSIWE